jgi:hypothetical protein
MCVEPKWVVCGAVSLSCFCHYLPGRLLGLSGGVLLNELILNAREIVLQSDSEGGSLSRLVDLAPLVDDEAHVSLKHLDLTVADLNEMTRLSGINLLWGARKKAKRQQRTPNERFARLENKDPIFSMRIGKKCAWKSKWEPGKCGRRKIESFFSSRRRKRTVAESGDNAASGVSNNSLGNTIAGTVNSGLIHDHTNDVDLHLEVQLRHCGAQLLHLDDCM